jgi:MFS family permease
MKTVQHGLRENWKQFSLLIIINSFVGGMAGMERSILPQIAEGEFHITAKTAILSFIIVFGITKAISNYLSGSLTDRFGRKNLLIAGWIFAIPVPFILMFAPSWNWIVAANILLGINQGLSWSATVVMKIDLAGEKQRGLAMGLNEFAGYLAVAAVAFLTGWVAGEYGLRPYPFYIGVIISVSGLLTSIFLVRDTRHHVTKETISSAIPRLKNIFLDTSWRNRNLASVTQAGLINNLNDGMVWGLFPVLLISKGLTIQQVAIVTAIYPAVWGIGQLFTGKMSDRFCKKDLLFYGMLLQGIMLIGFIYATSYIQFILLSFMLGLGTALVYPVFLASIAENTHPQDRAKSLGIFRFWRDLGYAIGAIITGLIADAAGINTAILFVGLLTLASGFIVHSRMSCTNEITKLFDWFRLKLSGKRISQLFSKKHPGITN